MPPELIPSTPVQWGIVGVLLMIVVAGVYGLMSGKLVARQVVEDIRKDRDERLEQAQEVIQLWKDAAEIRKSVVDTLMPVLDEMRKDNQVILKAAMQFSQQYEAGGGGK